MMMKTSELFRFVEAKYDIFSKKLAMGDCYEWSNEEADVLSWSFLSRRVMDDVFDTGMIKSAREWVEDFPAWRDLYPRQVWTIPAAKYAPSELTLQDCLFCMRWLEPYLPRTCPCSKTLRMALRNQEACVSAFRHDPSTRSIAMTILLSKDPAIHTLGWIVYRVYLATQWMDLTMPQERAILMRIDAWVRAEIPRTPPPLLETCPATISHVSDVTASLTNAIAPHLLSV